MLTLAAEPPGKVDAGLVTGVGTAGALVQVSTGPVVRLQCVAIFAGTLEAAHEVGAVLTAASIGVRTLINV